MSEATDEPGEDLGYIIVAQTEVPIETRCDSCGNVLDSGTWVVIIAVEGTCNFLGHDTPRICCGRERICMQIFEDRESAVEAYTEANERAEEEGIDSLPLVCAPPIPGLTRVC